MRSLATLAGCRGDGVRMDIACGARRTARQTATYNSLHAKFLGRNTNMYLHFMSLLHIDMTHVVEILSHMTQGPTWFTKSISWLQMTWLLASPGHQQP